MVMPHGGPHGSFVPMLTCLRYILLRMGYYLLHPNFSGSAGYGQAFLEANLSKIGEIDAAEIIDSLRNVLSMYKDIDKDAVHTHGTSYGGYMTAILGSRYSEYFKSGVIMNGVLNLIGNMWFNDIPEWNTVEGLGHTRTHSLTQEDYLALWRKSPSIPLKIPVIQFLGGKDRRVAWRQGLFFDAVNKDGGVDIKTYVY